MIFYLAGAKEGVRASKVLLCEYELLLSGHVFGNFVVYSVVNGTKEELKFA